MEAPLRALAELLTKRNIIDNEISALISRPASPGHIGEFIAAAVFHIDLFRSATQKASDGVFTAPPLQGKTVNIKLYGKQEGILDIRPDALPDLYLVLTGPKTGPVSSRGATRTLVIRHAYLFSSTELVSALNARGSTLGPASSVPQDLWQQAEVWPATNNRMLRLEPGQIQALELFTGQTGA